LVKFVDLFYRVLATCQQFVQLRSQNSLLEDGVE